MKSGPKKPQVVPDTGRASEATRVLYEGRSRLRVIASATGERVVTKEVIDDAEAHRLHNEAALGMRLEGVVGVRPVYGIDEHIGTPVLRLAYVEGVTLEEWRLGTANS